MIKKSVLLNIDTPPSWKRRRSLVFQNRNYPARNLWFESIWLTHISRLMSPCPDACHFVYKHIFDYTVFSIFVHLSLCSMCLPNVTGRKSQNVFMCGVFLYLSLRMPVIWVLDLSYFTHAAYVDLECYEYYHSYISDCVHISHYKWILIIFLEW